ncbi:MAG: hypothetical protein WC374_10510 [Phycisphaerae bacterium]|jgi:hypothetical protein
MEKSKWMNTERIIWKNNEIERPCHKCGFCPYGQLVEEYPLHEEATKYAIKHDMWVKWSNTKGWPNDGTWIKCKKDDNGAEPDINSAVSKVKEKFSCDVFGHNCPAYYLSENVKE